jgi:hypothetical protein
MNYKCSFCGDGIHNKYSPSFFLFQYRSTLVSVCYKSACRDRIKAQPYEKEMKWELQRTLLVAYRRCGDWDELISTPI